MKKLTKFLALISATYLAGCQSTNSVNTAENETIYGIVVKYLVPNNQLLTPKSIGGLRIQEHYLSQSDEQDQLLVRNVDNDTFAIQRTITNSFSGASKIVHVDHFAVTKGEFTEITLTPTYIKNLSLRPEDISKAPELNIVDTLSKSQFEFKFEVNSSQTPVMVQSKLKNKLAPHFYLPNTYNLDVFGINGFMVAEPISSNSGSTLIVQATLNTTKSDKNIIDVAALLKSLKRELQASIS